MIQWIRIGTKEVDATITVEASLSMRYCYLGNIDDLEFRQVIKDLVKQGNDIQVNSVNACGMVQIP